MGNLSDNTTSSSRFFLSPFAKWTQSEFLGTERLWARFAASGNHIQLSYKFTKKLAEKMHEISQANKNVLTRRVLDMAPTRFLMAGLSSLILLRFIGKCSSTLDMNSCALGA